MAVNVGFATRLKHTTPRLAVGVAALSLRQLRRDRLKLLERSLQVLDDLERDHVWLG